MKLKINRWTKGGAAYVLLVMALATAAAIDGDGTGFYVAAMVAAYPGYVIVYPTFFTVVVLVAMAAGVGIDGSGPRWILVPLFPVLFGAAAVINVLLVWLVARSAKPSYVRLRRLCARA